MIQIDHLCKAFTPDKRVVDDISLHVEAGEVFGFLGPNGAGKTTTIKILTTLLHPTSGTAVVAGHDVVEDPLSVRMSFGYVGQQSGVDPALTVTENLLLQGRLYHLPKKKLLERIRILIKLFDMEGREGQWVGALSGGLKRRLDIATSLIHEPKLLFLDEPTLGLDPKSRLDLWSYIRRLNQEEGMTLFLTTHHLEEVDQLAHRVGILDEGRIQIIGTPDGLKDSLGADAIHLSFQAPLAEEQLSLFRKNAGFKEVIQMGSEVRLYLEEGRKALPKVIQWLDEQDLSPKSVLLARPTFDDVYLKYTGKDWLSANEKKESEWGDWGGGAGGGKWKNKWNKDGEKNEGAQVDGDWKNKWNETQDASKTGEETEGGWESKWKTEAGDPKKSEHPEDSKDVWKNKWHETGDPSKDTLPENAPKESSAPQTDWANQWKEGKDATQTRPESSEGRWENAGHGNKAEDQEDKKADTPPWEGKWQASGKPKDTLENEANARWDPPPHKDNKSRNKD